MTAVSPLVLADLRPPLQPVLITDGEGLALLRDFLGRVTVVGFDVETNLTSSFATRKIRTIQLGNREEQYVIELLAFAGSGTRLFDQGHRVTPGWARCVVEALRPALEGANHLKVGVNLQFDYEALWWCLGLRPWNFYDCLLAEKVIHAGAVAFFEPDFWGLEDMVARYTRLKIDKGLQTSFDLSTPLTPEQVAYAALDVRLPLAVMAGQQREIEKGRLRATVDLENAAIPAFGDMHVSGIALDKDAWRANVRVTEARHQENVRELDTYFLPVVGAKQAPAVDLAELERAWRDEPDRAKRSEKRAAYQAARKALRNWAANSDSFEGEAAINYASNPQLVAALRQLGLGVKKLPNTNDKVLAKLASEYPAIHALQNYRETAKILTNYGEAFLEKYINPETGRVHSHISQLGAATGRTSSANPNIQNIPRGSEWRSCFKARPGCKLITADYSGCELRILAEVSGEEVWLEAFNKGWDVHSVGAELIFGERWRGAAEAGCAYYAKREKCACKGHKRLREQIKAINFGIAYGMEAGELGSRLGIAKAEAQKLLDLYRATFKKVTAYLKASGDKARMELAAFTIGGRRRLFTRPAWEQARRIAEERSAKDGKERVGTKDISRAYYALYASIEREGKNTPIQGTNADIIKLAMGAGADSSGKPYMWHRLWSEYKAEIVNMVHDELVIEAPEEAANACREFIGDCMMRAGAEFIKRVPMTYEAEIADVWKK